MLISVFISIFYTLRIKTQNAPSLPSPRSGKNTTDINIQLQLSRALIVASFKFLPYLDPYIWRRRRCTIFQTLLIF